MNGKDKSKKDTPYDLMQDTQYLLLGLNETESESYALEDILAEFGTEEPLREAEPAPVEDTVSLPAPKPEPEPELETELETEEDTPAPPDLPLVQALHPNVIVFPGAVAAPPYTAEDTQVLIDMREYDEEPSPRELLSPAPERREARPEPKPEPELPAPKPPKPTTMEDIVASTVDAVKAEQEKVQDQQRRRAEKKRKKKEPKRREPRADLPVEAETPQQTPKEAAVFHKRRWQDCRRGLLLSVPALIIMWIPWLLEKAGIAIPFYSESLTNAALCLLVAQLLLTLFCAGVLRAAFEELKEQRCTVYTYAALTHLIALLDAATLPILPGRIALMPLGATTGVTLVVALWGLKCYHHGMFETFRTAAMGEPSCTADRCDAGIARGRGRLEGFAARANMESTASQWQRLMLPALTAASIVFAILSSVGQGQAQDLLRCWSAVLCASCSLVCPMAYCVPLERVARRLNHNGTAVAGQYGAAVLSSVSKIVASDTDLFPHSSAALTGVKLYGEERSRAISYAATLAERGGGGMARAFEVVCQSEHIARQPLEHFHVHDDNGLSGMIRGETVLVGTPVFMRHRGVRLPTTLPTKTAVCLAVDGELTAIFTVKYTVSTPVEIALRALGRNSLQLVLATRDGNVTPKFVKKTFGADGRAVVPEISDRLALSDPERENNAPNGLIYRDGLLPFVELVSLSRRLCQMVRTGNLLSMLGSVFGALLAFYLTFAGRSDALSPAMLLLYLVLWTLPMLPLLVSVDKM